MYQPSTAEFATLATTARLVPVYRELLLDHHTPVSAYAALRGPGTFLLESVVGGEKWAAYSFIGVRAHASFTVKAGRGEFVSAAGTETFDGKNPARALEAFVARFPTAELAGLPRFFGGAVGYFGYEVVRAFETSLGAVDDADVPEAQFLFTDTLVIFDNFRQTVKVVAHADAHAHEDAYAEACARIDRVIEKLLHANVALPQLPIATETTLAPSSTFSRAEFGAAIARIKEYVLAGDAFQVVLSQRFSLPRPPRFDAFDAYRALRMANPSPYMFHLALPAVTVTGASPEVLVRIEDDRVEVRPIAGTRPRGKTPAEDLALEHELRADEKERAEHLMLIDLARNDLGRVARVGTVSVDEQFVIERYSHVMHLVSNVSAQLGAHVSASDVLAACFPAGTLSGAPKVRAMAIIDELEPVRRGVYGGAVGYLAYPTAGTTRANMDLAIAIRTLVTLPDELRVQAGAGIVADSDPDSEYDESVNKAKAVLRAVQLALGVA